MRKNKICIIGLGYVGYPLLLAFSKHFAVVGYDNNNNIIKKLNHNKIKNKNISFTSDLSKAKECNIYIVTVPTPVFKNKIPNLNPLKDACLKISKVIKKNDIIIFESTVYPGVTEEICAPLIEKISNLKYKKDFHCGYSPERINPGDQKHSLEKIVKITSGSSKKIANIIDNLYKKIIKAGTYKVSNIKIAEAAKVIENTQRDLNIAFMNELEIMFDKFDLNFKEILQAAKTKWNFLDFKPGLVGGHCISVDPYYLSYKSKLHNYNPKIILSGRDINDRMSKFYSNKFIKFIKKNKISHVSKKVLIYGFTFKKNVSDVRNTQVANIASILIKNKMNTSIYDPHINLNKIKLDYKYNFVIKPKLNFYNFIIIAVKHDKYKERKIQDFEKYLNKKGVIFDLNKEYGDKFFRIVY